MKKIILTILLFLLTKPLYAGTTFNNLRQSIKYIKLDEINEQIAEAKKASQKALSKEEIEKIKETAEEIIKSSKVSSSVFISNSLDRWHLKQLKKNIINGKNIDGEIMMLEAIRKVYAMKADFIATVFPDNTLAMFLSKKNGDAQKDSYFQEAKKFHLDIYDREVAPLRGDYDIDDLRNAIETHDVEYIKVMVNIIHESLKASEVALNQEDIDNIRKSVILGDKKKAVEIVDKALRVYASSAVGATVICSSQTL